MIKKKIAAIIKDQSGKAGNVDCEKFVADLDDVLQEGVTETVKQYRDQTAGSTAYETSLGSFIIEQNPYASWENIDFPNLPLDPHDENPWVRRSGVLRDNNALNPLRANEPIPGGTIVNFSYVNDPDLQDDGTFVKPPGDLPKDPNKPPKPAPDRTDFYPHNIVKAVRLRYSVFDRRFGKLSSFADTEGRDRQTGYILILYSGSDGR